MEQENIDENLKENNVHHRTRTIRDVSLGEELREQKIRFERSLSERGKTESRPRRHRRGIKYAGYIIAAFFTLVLVFVGFLASSLFSRAVITIVPKTQTVEIDEDLVVSETAGDGLSLAYEVLSIDSVSSQILKGGSEQEVERRATGKITVYNAYSNEPQTLVTNTRFESADGAIYRIDRSVVVPGIKANGSPGTLEVVATSDEPGEEYNLSSGRFTIPGLQGTDLYESMYAEVQEPIVGGFVGLVETVDSEAEEKAREENREELLSVLEARIVESLPEEYVFVPKSVVVEFTDMPNESKEGSVTVSTRGTLYGVMFKQDILSAYFANQYLADYNNEPLAIDNPTALTFEIKNEEVGLTDIQNELDFSIRGNAVLVWGVDTEKVKETFAGTARGDFQSVASGILGVHRADLELIPGFMRSIPRSSEKIQVVLERES